MAATSFEEDEARRQKEVIEQTSFDLDNLNQDGIVEMMIDEKEEIRRTPAMDLAAQIVASAESIKSVGSDYVKKNLWREAIAEYDKALELLSKEKSKISADYESELLAEKCELACRNNKALCALKLMDWSLAKLFCAEGLQVQERAKVPDASSKAKLLFRRGQAQLGNGEARNAVDSMAQALEIEEQLLGVSSKDATIKSTNSDKQRVTTIAAIKRELQKARKLAKAEDQRTKENFKGARGFLQGGKGVPKLTDTKTERKEILEEAMNNVLKSLFEDKDLEIQKACIMRQISSLSKLSKPNDLNGQTKYYFVRGFMEFLAGETMNENQNVPNEHYQKAASHLDMCWARRSEMATARFGVRNDEEEDPLFVHLDLDEDSECFFPIGKICAIETTGHSMLRANQYDPARAYLIAFAQLATANPIAALHNLPDGFLLEKGLPKMDDKQRRAHRWKYRSHEKRAIFDAYVAIASASRRIDDRDMALDAALKALNIAETHEHKRAAHNNLAFLYGSKWSQYGEPTSQDQDLALLHSSLSQCFQALHEEEQRKKDEPPPGASDLPETDDAIQDEAVLDPQDNDVPMPDISF
uniref:peptidylprolyl isomerase n=1 Tax=Aureoumbra lagunensis TaxID=44058 RepID=A0A7S3JNW6_9STRA|mmetsp:Transcript_23500/g.30549  ORF Transcript_23500/g.30549 Transcript_23500/m.30549 type:complete len:585 (+) Transcript_23500:79-1833(+)|eukprot:CAMPEP_0197286370 /NCGR_PEP_ID=MMETSP0890-20130614/1796_1 /TAXON_ID=44058 ORGANISM="Aureoumbra lagunensis, Strain CCMP1510" /NCGR_SAMPLE_ID=MMETSP0890 /ASSEMBLY_ACC=CAM_ASM_000533 /LENGTH=584 /DNA_ID=CAMNT_0042754647 /DNA_START=44 /DNA_END=1798 /DNA_ORIENTATION=-